MGLCYSKQKLENYAANVTKNILEKEEVPDIFKIRDSQKNDKKEDDDKGVEDAGDGGEEGEEVKKKKE